MKGILSAIISCLTLALQAQPKWNADSLGNIRAVVAVNSGGQYARVVIPWRRPDAHPEQRRIIVQDSSTGALVTGVAVGAISNASGEVSFQTLSGKGLYYIYYMPYRNEGRSNYPKGVYLSPFAGEWKPSGAAATAVFRGIESIDSFNSYSPMQVIATPEETTAIIKASGQKEYLVFPEDRRYPIRMSDRLPQRWTSRGYRAAFTGSASRGENYSFQLGVYALKALSGLRVSFGDFHAAGGVIPGSSFSCLNTNGIDYTGKSFTKTVGVAAGQVQALWCLADIPKDIPAGLYKGSVSISFADAGSVAVPVSLQVGSEVLEDGGISHPEEQTRLKWLNSTMMQENTVIAPYTDLKVEGNTISLLGRRVMLAPSGLPARIQTFFTPEMTGIGATPNELLSAPLSFDVAGVGALKYDGVRFTKKEPGTVEWMTTATGSGVALQTSAHLEFDGYLQYQIRLVATQDVSPEDISLNMPFKRSMARYMMGLGRKGGDCPESFDWKWQVATKNQDGAWIGSVNAGLQYSLRDEKYSRPLNTNFYLQKPLLLPSSWGNGEKGGISMSAKDGAFLVHNYSGGRTMKKGDTLYYNVTFLITPFHTINTDFQWATRFYHRYNKIDSIAATGATVVNIHHATPINPWINYPFIEWRAMKNYIDEAHTKGLKVKIYNTVRELSDRAWELFPMRSLGHEIYSPGKGGGFSWLQEHVGDDYIPAWFVPEIKDAALINSGMSRWHNYYVEGMNWLVQNVGIDGIYLDDVAFDRVTMKRIKRVLTRDGHPGIIDLHSANQYNKSDGFNNSANLYMEHFPYLNRLWFGEYFDYEKNDPSFFLTEVSGIPFGLMGEMLQDGGNPWRGMVYGMTNRMPWSDNADPRAIWKVWDEFGMKGSEMIGYWSGHCPVTTSNPHVLATVFRKPGSSLVAIASWASSDTTVGLNIDWARLGIDSSRAVIEAPAIRNFQPAATFRPGDAIPVGKGKGWLLIIKAAPGVAKIQEYKKEFPTYPFSDPSPIPMNTAVYPYFRYDGFTAKAVGREWKVVELENSWIRLLILPEIGGKVWAAIEKSTNKPFLYYNHAVKFRDVAMRGPWTSGGLEANYGIIGHTPNCATPVDYLTRTNDDGSVSCFIGALDLLTRSYWRVEIRLPADKAWFTTRSFWYNATPLDQPYYHWMNAGLKADGDLEFIYPGNKYLGHNGEYGSWPVNPSNGKNVAFYKNNDFGGYKSYHVFGKYTDFAGAYWHDDDYGMIRYGTHDDKAGKKIWIWGLSRQGMIWDKLLTDTDGQYVELQSGRLFNQNVEKSSLTPFKHLSLAPYQTDSWKEYWYPVLGTRGIVAASEYGALNVVRDGSWVKIRFSPTCAIDDTLRVGAYVRALHLAPLQLFVDSFSTAGGRDPSPAAGPDSLAAMLGHHLLTWSSSPTAGDLSRPVDAPAGFDWGSSYGHYLAGCEDMDQKNYAGAEGQLDSSLQKDAWFLPALVKKAELLYRNMRYEEALDLARRALSIHTEDGGANFIYGLANMQLGRNTDAADGFDIASLSPAWRSAAYTQLSRLHFRSGNWSRAASCAEKALVAQPQNIDALQLQAVIARQRGDDGMWRSTLATLLTLDPLDHFARFETGGAGVTALIRNELPQETYLELAIWYYGCGLSGDAIRVLALAPPVAEVKIWQAWLTHQPLDTAALDPVRAFPFRSETGIVLESMVGSGSSWFLRYQLALIYKDRNRLEEARRLVSGLTPSFAPFYAFRAVLDSSGARADLERAAALDPSWRYAKLLAEYELAHGDVPRAVDLAGNFYRAHPDSYVMGLLYARALLANRQYASSVKVLRGLDIIPFEGATVAHDVYRDALLAQAEECIHRKEFAKARRLIAEAKQWPENLGVGEPYPADQDLRREEELLKAISER